MRVGDVNVSFPRPRGAVMGFLVAIGAIWLVLALSINWAGATEAIVRPVVGNTELVLRGQVWRLLTAPFIHVWSGDQAVSHVLTTLMILYFFGPTLEKHWGAKRFVVFMLASAVFGYVCQTLIGRLVGRLDQPAWFGGLGMADALIVAWALQADRSSRVMLFFVLPISPIAILWITVALNVLKVIAIGNHFEGLVTPFGSMLMGWLLSDRAPLGNVWRRFRKGGGGGGASPTRGGRSAATRGRAAAHGLRVIPGEGESRDKRYLN